MDNGGSLPVTCVPVGNLEGYTGPHTASCGCAKWTDGRGKARRQDVRAVVHEDLMTRNTGNLHNAEPFSCSGNQSGQPRLGGFHQNP